MSTEIQATETQDIARAALAGIDCDVAAAVDAERLMGERAKR